MRTPVVGDQARYYIGIDPGLSGVMAVMRDDGGQLVISTDNAPTLRVQKTQTRKRQKKVGTSVQYDVHAFGDLLKPFRGRRVIAGVEHLRGYPGASSQSVFGMGFGFGLWVMALAMNSIPYSLVLPQTWKRALSVLGSKGQDDHERKAATVLRAKQLFPWLQFPFQKDHNRADAVLIAEFMRRTNPL